MPDCVYDVIINQIVKLILNYSILHIALLYYYMQFIYILMVSLKYLVYMQLVGNKMK